jgi:GMP synthase (glutamine-hydrolysing)
VRHELICIVDFGSQYTQLIARRVRELNVYCEIHPYDGLPGFDDRLRGVILSGGPSSVRDPGAPSVNLESLRKKVPVLGICYGAQLMVQRGGGQVLPSSAREYGRARLKVPRSHALFANVAPECQVWMSHSDTISDLPPGFAPIAHTDSVKVAAFEVAGEPTFGLQFHPEVVHTSYGKDILANFLFSVCRCTGDWSPGSFVEETVASLRAQLGADHVVMGLSGGVDSGVAAHLLHRAIGPRLHCLFIDNGLLRKNEAAQVESAYGRLGLNIGHVDASERFYAALAGVADPERKRKIIGRVFVEVFEENARAISGRLPPGESVKWLGQGTIYPDVIESVSVKGPSATIKSHHNVGGLPEKMNLRVVEPLRSLFKDEVRRTGTALGMDADLLNRHPFPGPGLGVRILGDSACCRKPTTCSSPRCGGTTCTMPSGRPAPCCCPCGRWASWATSAPMKTPWRCAPLRRSTE